MGGVGSGTDTETMVLGHISTGQMLRAAVLHELHMMRDRGTEGESCAFTQSSVRNWSIQDPVPA